MMHKYPSCSEIIREAQEKLFYLLYSTILVKPDLINTLLEEPIFLSLIGEKSKSSPLWEITKTLVHIISEIMQRALPFSQLVEFKFKKHFFPDNSTLASGELIPNFMESKYINHEKIAETIMSIAQVSVSGHHETHKNYTKSGTINLDCPSFRSDENDRMTQMIYSMFPSSQKKESKTKGSDFEIKIDASQLTKFSLSEGKEENMITYLTRSLPVLCTNVLDFIIKAIVTNCIKELDRLTVENSQQQNRYLTVELFYSLLYLIKKHPYITPYVFLKKLNLADFPVDLLPNKFPYSKIIHNSQNSTWTFLDVILRVIIPVTREMGLPFVGLFLDKCFVRITEESKILDLNQILLIKMIASFEEIIEEALETKEFLTDIQSFEYWNCIAPLITFIFKDNCESEKLSEEYQKIFSDRKSVV